MLDPPIRVARVRKGARSVDPDPRLSLGSRILLSGTRRDDVDLVARIPERPGHFGGTQ